nr:DUF6035 family protein [Duganella fentianensis]
MLERAGAPKIKTLTVNSTINQPLPPFYVPDPEIPEVLDLEHGTYHSLAEIVGTDYAKAVQLRMDIKAAQLVDKPLFACAECGVPVSLLSRKDTRRFFFKHTVEDGRCSAITRGELTQEEITARKYNGAKESRLHLRMKELVRRSLLADAHFSEVEVESTWKGLSGTWRKPDVQSLYTADDGTSVRVAFEIQLSTTFLDVIAERRQFYTGENGLLFWVFAEFNDSGRKLTQDDVFYNNNQNAFLMNEDIAQLSISTKSLHFECAWAEPLSATTVGPLKRQSVSFEDLTFDLKRQQVFYFDFATALAQLAQQESALLQVARENFEAAWIAHDDYERPISEIWQEFYRGVRASGIRLPNYPKDPYHILVSALYTAKHGKVIGWRFNRVVEVAHRIAGGHPQYLRIFRLALKVYGRTEQIRAEDKSGKWAERMRKSQDALRSREPQYEHDSQYDEAISILFPELFTKMPY